MNDDVTTEALPCADKITYDSKEAATGSAAAVEWQRGIGLKVYNCRYCHLWHLSTNHT